jgi:hypothetical protein
MNLSLTIGGGNEEDRNRIIPHLLTVQRKRKRNNRKLNKGLSVRQSFRQRG